MPLRTGAVLYRNAVDLGDTIFVNSLNDLPKPVAGVITLEEGKSYNQMSDVDFGLLQININNSRYSGSGTNLAMATYTGVDHLFNASGNSTVDNLRIDTPNGSPLEWFETTTISTMRWFDCTVVSCEKAGDFTSGGGNLRINNLSWGNIKTEGFTFNGVFGAFKYTSGGIHLNGGTLFNTSNATFTSTLELLTLTLLTFPVGTVFLEGVGDSNFGPSGTGLVERCSFTGGGTPLVGVDVTDLRWEFLNSHPLENTSISVDMFLSDHTEVTINNSGLFYPVGGVLWVEDIANRFTSAVDGVVTYTGLRPDNILVIVTLTLEKTGGGSDEIAGGVSLNGVTTGNAFTKTITSTDSNTPTSITCTRLVKVVTGDTISAYVANLEGNSNIDVIRGSLDIIGS